MTPAEEEDAMADDEIRAQADSMTADIADYALAALPAVIGQFSKAAVASEKEQRKIAQIAIEIGAAFHDARIDMRERLRASLTAESEAIARKAKRR